MCKHVIRACCYKEHLRDICRDLFCFRQYLLKKKEEEEEDEEEEREKNEKWELFFMQKSYMCMYMKKVEYSFAIFWFNVILGLDL